MDLVALGYPYHRLARTAAHRWWRPWLAVLVAVLAWITLMVPAFGAVAVAAALLGRPTGPDGLPSLGVLGDLALSLVVIAALVPVTMLTVRWVQRRPAGTLSSVAGRIRWRRLLRCLLPAAAVPVVTLAGGLALIVATAGTGALTGDDVAWPGWGSFLLTLVLLVLLVPLQAAGEEYAFRGFLLQALGSVLRRPLVPILVQAVLFAAMHGWGTVWGFADLVVFGVLAGWLTVRTGGIEAAVALHVMTNLVAFGLAAALGQLAAPETAADMPWQMAVVDVVVLAAYTVIVLRISAARPDQPALVGERDRLHPVAQVRLGEHPGEVRLDGGLAQVQRGGDPGVGQPARHQPQHVGLPVGQGGRPGGPLRVDARGAGQ